MFYTLINHRNDLKMCETQVELRTASEFFQRRFLVILGNISDEIIVDANYNQTFILQKNLIRHADAKRFLLYI